MNIIRELASRVMPAACLLCGDRPGAGGLLCQECLADLPGLDGACPACGRPRPGSTPCGPCLQRRPIHDRLIAAYRYQFPVDDLIRGFKYHGRLGICDALAPALARGIDDRLGSHLPQVMLPVPLHRWRLYRRGFNQSLEIARRLNRSLGIPIDTRLLRRHRATREQARLGPAERRRNLRRAFVLNGECTYDCVAIVDDVVTTGATVTELARLLRRHGVKEIQVWALARTAGEQ